MLINIRLKLNFDNALTASGLNFIIARPDVHELHG